MTKTVLTLGLLNGKSFLLNLEGPHFRVDQVCVCNLWIFKETLLPCFGRHKSTKDYILLVNCLQCADQRICFFFAYAKALWISINPCDYMSVVIKPSPIKILLIIHLWPVRSKTKRYTKMWHTYGKLIRPFKLLPWPDCSNTLALQFLSPISYDG